MGKVSSRYRDDVMFQCVSQESVVCNSLDDADEMYAAKCSIDDSPTKYRLFATNPLHNGFYLDHIMSGNMVFSCNCNQQLYILHS